MTTQQDPKTAPQETGKENELQDAVGGAGVGIVQNYKRHQAT